MLYNSLRNMVAQLMNKTSEEQALAMQEVLQALRPGRETVLVDDPRIVFSNEGELILKKEASTGYWNLPNKLSFLQLVKVASPKAIIEGLMEMA